MSVRFRYQEDQAHKLRQQVDEASTPLPKKNMLPSRSEIHRQKDEKKKPKVKFKHPLIRLLVFSFVLLPVIAYLAYNYYVEKEPTSNHVPHNEIFEVIKVSETRLVPGEGARD
ncbi:hypothetical protein [Metabacillus iocasae]|uniref:Uncharacterized protein n=1 Tax=Priestia iocasae TaxID=2291674 RepID=A0ABS2QQH4_9BACI|nr:hypothetical protein [Metabacillus iocasae]MBM7701691.1 hypothetical protein [Metabacillus iocasae]